MLKVFRDNLKYLSWVLWLVIAVFILFVFVDFGTTVDRSGGAPNAAAVTVGNQEISWGEFQRAYQNAEAFYRQIYGDRFSNDTAKQLGIPLQVVDTLIADKILLNEADRIGLIVTDEELRDQILAQGAFKSDDGAFIGQDEYSALLRRNGLTVDAFERDQRTQLLSQKVRAVLSENLFVPETDVEKAYRDQVEKAKIRLIKLTPADLTEEVTLSASEVETYFAGAQEDFRVPERRVADYLLVDRLAIQNSLEVGADEVQAYYDENSDAYRSEEQAQARHILLKVDANRDDATAERELNNVRSRIEAGEDFAELAKELSEDPGSGARGGDLGFFGRGAMVKPFDDAVFGAEPGSLIGPIKTNFGYHLIEVLARREAGLQPLTEVESQIRQQLVAERAGSVAESKVRELADRITKENLAPEAWNQLAESEVGVSVETSEAFGRDDFVTGIGRSTEFSVRAFELEPGTVSEPMTIGRGWVLLGVKSIEAPRLPELDEVRDEVETALREEKKREAVLERVRTAAAEFEQGKTLDEIASDLGAEPEETALFGRTGAVGSLGRNSSVADAALALSTGELGGPVETETGAILFEVMERERFNAETFAEEKASTLATLKSRRFQELIDSLIQARRQELGIRLDPTLLQNFDLPTQSIPSTQQAEAS